MVRSHTSRTDIGTKKILSIQIDKYETNPNVVQIINVNADNIDLKKILIM